MSDEEAKRMMEDLYPLNQERWVKVKYLDRVKCQKVFRWNNKDGEENGYEVTAIGIRDEYIPQVSALMGLRDDVLSFALSRGISDPNIEQLNTIFKKHIDELKYRTIVESPQI